MSPVESRKRNPRFWKAYDDAGKLSLDLTSRRHALAALPTVPGDRPALLSTETLRAIELLNLLRDLLRERIEADAAAGKAGAP